MPGQGRPMGHGRPALGRARLRAVALAFACAVTACAAAPASSSAALPPQGVYEACHPGTGQPNDCVGRLQRVGGAGFGLVLNYWMLSQSTPAQILAYANAASAAGVKLIWPLNEWWSQAPGGTNMASSYPNLAAACGCTTNQGIVDYVVRLAARQPSTWGYYIADEPGPDRHADLARFTAAVRSDDPAHPQLI